MNISPILIIISAAVLLFAIIYCVINRPRKPVFTGVLIFMLLAYVLMTFSVNIKLSSSGTNTLAGNGFISGIVSFIAMTSNPTVQQLTNLFSSLCKVDVCLIIATIISMIIEIKNLFSQNKSK